MTNTTTADRPPATKKRRQAYWWIWPLSLAIHAALLAILIGFGALSTNIMFDRDELTRDAQAAEERARERDNRERAERQERRYPPEHRDRLQREIERRPRLAMIRHIKSLERSREKIEIAKEERLEEITERTPEDYQQKLLEQIVALAKSVKLYSVSEKQRSGLFLGFNQKSVTKITDSLPQSEAEKAVFKALETIGKTGSKRAGEGKYYADESTAQISAAVERVAQIADRKQGIPEQTQEERQSVLDLIDKLDMLRQAIHRHQISWPNAAGGANSVVKAIALQSSPDNREIALELIAITEDIIAKTDPLLAEKRYPPKQLHQATEELRSKVMELLDDKPDMAKLNDVSPAQRPPDPETAESELKEQKLQKATPEELHATASKLEKEIEQNFNDSVAADMAKQNNTSLKDALAAIKKQDGTPRDDLGEPLAQSAPQTVGEMNERRETLDTAADQTESMARNGRFLLSQLTGEAEPVGDSEFVDAMGGASEGEGPGTASEFDSVEGEGGEHMTERKPQPTVRFGYNDVLANALPGRRFSNDTPRTGWLYVDTWYLIGPWENQGRIDYTTIHPPESEIDFDAAYLGGKAGNRRKSAKDNALRWRFTQSDNMRIRPIPQSQDSTFYAYTELYFEEDKELLVGSPADDCVRVWVNGEIVRDENGLAQWSFNQAFYPVKFKKGTNKVLVRLENGPGEVQFTFILVPQELAQPKK